MSKMLTGAWPATIMMFVLGCVGTAPPSFASSFELSRPSLNISNSFHFYQPPLTSYALALNRFEAESQWNATWASPLGPLTFRATPWSWFWAEKKLRPQIDLQEAWVEWASNAIEIRVGQQIVSWGAADSLNPTDAWNPWDFFDLFNGKKLGTPTARVILHPASGPLENTSLELLASPFFRPSFLPISIPTVDGVGFEVSDNRMLLPLPTGISVSGATESIVYSMNSPSYPTTWQFAARLRLQRFLGADFSASYFSVVENLPRVAYTSVRPVVVPPYTALTLYPSYHRMQQVGLDMATDFSIFGEEFSLRMEGALIFPDNARALTAGSAYQSDLLRDPYFFGVVGIDHTFAQRVFGTVLYMNLMGVLQERFNQIEIPAGSLTLSGLPNYRPWDRNLVWYVESRISDRFKLSHTLVASLKNGDALLRPGVHYQWHDKLHSKLQADFFVGSRQGFFGQFYQAPRVGLMLQWFVL
jgi:hypothetical protein